MSEQTTLPGCSPAGQDSPDLTTLLSQPHIKIFTPTALNSIARSVAQAKHFGSSITSVKWNVATFHNQPAALIVTYRLRGDSKDLPDRHVTQPL